MKAKIFIDGQEGTTGLQIYERLGGREDIELLLIDSEKRKDVSERRRLINSADLVFLCLPDEAAIESASLVENSNTRIIDASTAHRTNPDWVYGFPEFNKEQRGKIATAQKVANPGCHATGVISATYPLIHYGLLPIDYPLTCVSLTGYSGGGKSMINDYENEKTPQMFAPRMYGLNLKHKHLPEIIYMTGLTRPPVFLPVVDDYYAGIAASISLHNDMLIGAPTANDILEKLLEYYDGEEYITVNPKLGDGMLESNWGEGTNNLELTVSGYDDLTLVTARFDNLGKGASGAAVQNMEIMLNLEVIK
ncbi:MAG: N-acetyl-gamma-glutamyl-phosphate reductase [Oscillospiraceae bacterium]|nr:N-acetyl-gamma-glutamyl-phosphate reductase [Oscillospiraceae bacterium]